MAKDTANPSSEQLDALSKCEAGGEYSISVMHAFLPPPKLASFVALILHSTRLSTSQQKRAFYENVLNYFSPLNAFAQVQRSDGNRSG